MAKKKANANGNTASEQTTDAAAEMPVGEVDNEIAMDSADTMAATEEEGSSYTDPDIPADTNGNGTGNGTNGAELVGSGRIEVQVDPDNLLIDPNLRALRSWSGGSKQELALPELARTMYEEGQEVPCLAYETAEGPVLYDGHRRREAAVIIRDDYDATWMLRVVIDPNMTSTQALRRAMLADSQHEHFTPIELGRNIKFLRKQFGWEGSKGTEQVRLFLGLGSLATVTQMERLLEAPKNIQDDVESGKLTPTTALDLIAMTANVAEEERPAVQAAVVEVAQKKAETDKQKRAPLTQTQKKAAERVREAAKTDKQKRENAAPTSTTATPAPAKIEGKHIRQAAKEVMGDKAKVKAPRMSEAVELIEPWTGPAYPPVMMKFAAAFCEWGRGKLTDKKLEAAWDDVADALAPSPATTTTTTHTPAATAPKPGKAAVAVTVKKKVGGKTATAPPAVKATGKKVAVKKKAAA